MLGHLLPLSSSVSTQDVTTHTPLYHDIYFMIFILMIMTHARVSPSSPPPITIPVLPSLPQFPSRDQESVFNLEDGGVLLIFGPVYLLSPSSTALRIFPEDLDFSQEIASTISLTGLIETGTVDLRRWPTTPTSVLSGLSLWCNG